MNSSAINTKKAYVKGQWVFWYFDILYHFHQLCKLYKPNLNFWVHLGPKHNCPYIYIYICVLIYLIRVSIIISNNQSYVLTWVCSLLGIVSWKSVNWIWIGVYWGILAFYVVSKTLFSWLSYFIVKRRALIYSICSTRVALRWEHNVH